MPDSTTRERQMSGCTTRSINVPARFSALRELLAPLSAGESRIGEEAYVQTLLRAQLAVEELFANSIHHGYGEESDRSVWLAVEHHDEMLRVTYADAARAFDPFDTIKPLSEIVEIPLEERHVGGLGRLLVRELAQRCEYRREDGRNVTVLEFVIS